MRVADVGAARRLLPLDRATTGAVLNAALAPFLAAIGAAARCLPGNQERRNEVRLEQPLMLRTAAEAGDDAAEHQTAAVTIIASLLLLVVVPQDAVPTAARSGLGANIAGPRCASAARSGTATVGVEGDRWGGSRRLLAWLRDRFMNGGGESVVAAAPLWQQRQQRCPSSNAGRNKRYSTHKLCQHRGTLRADDGGRWSVCACCEPRDGVRMLDCLRCCCRGP